jgi:hypothetical protein
MADAVVSRDRYLAGVGLFLTQDEFKESCFPPAVSPDQAQTLAGIHLKADVREKLPGEIRLGKPVDLNHKGLLQ